MEDSVMRRLYIGLVLIVVVGALVGCGGGQAAPAPAEEETEETYASEVLETSYDDALDVSAQLAFGTMQLEETDNAVTPEQATALLPLWQALRGGVTARSEVNAVLKQIEGTMTQEQLEAIAAMQLTQEDLQAYVEEEGMNLGGRDQERPEGEMPPQGEFGEGEMPPQGEFGEGEMPPEMATRMAEFEDMTEEERQAARATAQAGGDMAGRPAGAPGAGGGQFMIILNPLIKLLETRSAG
jgi:hypothetical protein